MAIFVYRGMDQNGRMVKSSITAESISHAKSKLSLQKIMLTSIREQKSGVGGGSSISFGGGVNIEGLSLMTRQLATLIRAKVQIVEALGALVDQTEQSRMKIILSEVRQKVNEGSSLAGALAEYPKVFDNVYVNMVEAGEQSGTLEVVLLRLADFTEARMKLKSKIKSALTYPVIMVGVGAVMFGIIFTFVIPKLAKVFIAMKKELPWTTKLCIAMSDFFVNYWYIAIMVLFFSYVSFKKYINTDKGRGWWDGLLLKLPIVGGLVTMINIGRFCSTLATLLNSGVPILTAMNIVKNLVANVHMQKAVEHCSEQVREGAGMSRPLADSGLFPPLVTHMIALGERSGELGSMLKIVSESYEDQVENKLSGLTATLEPLMMVVMGVSVGFIVFSVVTPMMELNSIK